MALFSRISGQNDQWTNKDINSWPIHRDLFAKIWQDIDIKPMIFLTGPRRVGKSIILDQLAEKLTAEKSVSPKDILFFEFNQSDTDETIWEVFETFKKQVVSGENRRLFIFFDEIQFVKGYENVIKEIYDNHNVKIALTGSLSLSYKRRMKESMAGRFFPYHLFPLNFREYLKFKNSTPISIDPTSNLIRNQQLDALNTKFRDFLEFGRFPETINLTPDQTRAYAQTILGQSLTQDAFSYFKIEKPQIMLALFAHIQKNNGSEIKIQNLASEIGANRETIAAYIDILEQMGLIYILKNTTNPLKMAKSSRKAYTSSTFALLESKRDFQTTFGFAAESYCLERLLEKSETVTFFRERDKEIDFLLPEKKIAYEVKFRSKFAKVTLPKKLTKFKLETLSLSGENPVCLF